MGSLDGVDGLVAVLGELESQPHEVAEHAADVAVDLVVVDDEHAAFDAFALAGLEPESFARRFLMLDRHGASKSLGDAPS